MGWRSKVETARKLHRPSLKDWECDGLADDFPSFVNRVLGTDRRESFVVSSEIKTPCSIPVILDAQNLTKEEFFDEYEATLTPCIIRGIPDGYDGAKKVGEWPAIRKWSLTSLDESVVRSRVFKCGEDDNGKSIKIRLKHFLRYLRNNRDDSPLYIFDSGFDIDRHGRAMLSDYRVPSYFSDDLFRFVSESRRPPYRWFLVGPERSGTTVHIDPLSTSAWNTLVHGKKRWVLFPPHLPKRVVKGNGLVREDEDDEAIHYFMNILPRIKQKAANQNYKGFACYEFTQYAGETVFVPDGWWHAVLNLTDTVGVTQNFVSPRNFDSVWLKTRTERKRMAWKWLCKLDEHCPELAQRARQMNENDRFRMKYDPAENKRRRREERRRSHHNV